MTAITYPTKHEMAQLLRKPIQVRRQGKSLANDKVKVMLALHANLGHCPPVGQQCRYMADRFKNVCYFHCQAIKSSVL